MALGRMDEVRSRYTNILTISNRIPMPIPSEIIALIERLNQEFNQTEQEATDALNIVRRNLSFFPNNVIMTQYFAYLNTILFSVETYKRQVQAMVEIISPTDVPAEVIQEAGEDLGNLLGRAIESKMAVRRIISRLEG
ncbi:hypothetical protein LAY57_09960 [Argonema antarcticum A004/B2]|nr:hypothetical protein [Argonema antarcticum A004/B2]